MKPANQITAEAFRRSFPTKARGSVRKRSAGMNKLEQAYAATLRARQSAGEVVWFAFEPIKLRLADDTYYIPDFLVLLADFTLEVHEAKGHWEDDARVKIKVAAECFPLGFVAVTRDKAGWKYERI